MTGRRIEPEILDSLPSGDPRAVHSRRDLRRLNALMGHVGILDEQLGLSRAALRPRRILDLGGGDGWFAYQLLRRVPEPPAEDSGEMVLVDRNPSLSPGLAGALDGMGWPVHSVAEGVLDWLANDHEGRPFDVCLCNLFLHHFRDQEIQAMMLGLRERARIIVAYEPRRSRRALWAARCVGAVGANAVTRHDAVVSVRAGFDADELTQLWTSNPSWTTQERPVGWFSHYFCARRLDADIAER